MATSPVVDLRNVDFVLHELLKVEALTRYPRFAAHSRETFSAALSTAHQLAVEKFAPHRAKSDREEPHLVDGKVRLPPEVKAALDAFAEAGYPAASADAELGGMQLPWTVTLACDAMFIGANAGTAGYPLLARGVAGLIEVFGNEQQKRLYLPPLLQGRAHGTMCLSEPQAGSSLTDLSTVATPAPEGHYLLTGSKMWISGGEHELSDNIIHMVLARTPDAPPGPKGISLFLVPRYLVNEDGSRGARNDVVLAGLNHKMGYRGTVNTVLSFGEQGRCVGYLVGTLHRGLAQMFQMMNEARLGVGMGAVMLGSAGYLNDPDEARLRDAGLLLDLLTPVVKAWSSDWCLKANELAIQVLGGYGYTREYPVEQLYRDNRLNPIHEGANGIQAMDLLGRKAIRDGGAALQLLMAEVEATRAQAAEVEELAPLATALGEKLGLVAETTLAVGACLQQGRIRLGLANASHYMTLMGHVIIAWMWLRQAVVAARALPGASEQDAAFYRGKLQACRFFFAQELPLVEHSARVLRELDSTALDMQPDWF